MTETARRAAGPVLGTPWPGWLRPVLLVMTAAVSGLFAVLAFALVPLLGEVEDRLSDRVKLALAPGPIGQDPRISFVALDEATMATLPYRSPMDRGLLADVLDALAAGGAIAVGFDVLMDQPTEADKDARLAQQIRDFPGKVVLAWADQSAGLTDAQSAWLAEFGAASEAEFGYVNLIAGTQGVVRANRPLFGQTGIESFSVALAKARRPDASIVDGLIDWRQAEAPGSPSFQTTPAHVLPLLRANPAILKTWFEGRIVIVGADLPLQDRHETPLSVLGIEKSATPGAIIHAHLISQMLDGRTVARMGWLPGMALLVGLSAAAILAAHRVRSAGLKAIPVLLVTLGYLGLVLYTASSGWTPGPLAPAVLAAALAYLGLTVVDSVAASRDRQFIQGAFSQYLAPELVTRLIKNPAALQVGGERREMSFLFTDIAGFTTLSEQMDPDAMTAMLNSYLDGVCEIIIANKGVIDKFIGDAVVALFGVPGDLASHAANALVCARQIDRFSQDFRAQAGHEALGETRIGVHTGIATVGNFGGFARFDYTAIGDAMNTAARLEGANKYFGTRIAVSGASLSAAAGHLPEGLAVQPIGDVILKGKSDALHVATLRSDSDHHWLERYNEAYLALKKSPACAITAFEALGDDPVAAFHLRRLRGGEEGTRIVMTEK